MRTPSPGARRPREASIRRRNASMLPLGRRRRARATHAAPQYDGLIVSMRLWRYLASDSPHSSRQHGTDLAYRGNGLRAPFDRRKHIACPARSRADFRQEVRQSRLAPSAFIRASAHLGRLTFRIEMMETKRDAARTADSSSRPRSCPPLARRADRRRHLTLSCSA